MEILVNVSGQRLRVESNFKNLVSGSQKFVKFSFNLADDWDELTVFAQFIQGENSYNQFLDENKCAYLPAEIVPGICTMVLCGTKEETIAVTNGLTLNIDNSLLVKDAQSTEISISLYMKLVDMMRNFVPKEGSITRAAMDEEVSSLLNNAEEALTKSVYDKYNRETDVFEYSSKKANEGKIIKNAKGENVVLTDAAEANILGLIIYGKTTSDGESLGDSGEIEIIISADGQDTQEVMLTRKELLPLRSAGDIKDTIEIKNNVGKLVRRVNANFTESLVPTIIPLTNEEVMSIMALMTHKNKCSVMVDGGGISVDYVVDMETHIKKSFVNMVVEDKTLVVSIGDAILIHKEPMPMADYIRKIIEETYITN